VRQHISAKLSCETACLTSHLDGIVSKRHINARDGRGDAEATTSGIPIAAGENVSTLMEFERLLAAKAVDFVQPSPAKMGGISELCKVFPLAAIHNTAVMPHSFYDGPGLLAAIHTAAAMGTADSMIEWRRFDLEAQIYGGALTPERSRISVPQGPGLGIDPDPDVMRACRWE
jgi:L-alanine-DL-glutamate epimerase-like enolase superfamily enzyme